MMRVLLFVLHVSMVRECDGNAGVGDGGGVSFLSFVIILDSTVLRCLVNSVFHPYLRGVRAGDRHCSSCDSQWQSSEPHSVCIGCYCSWYRVGLYSKLEQHSSISQLPCMSSVICHSVVHRMYEPKPVKQDIVSVGYSLSYVVAMLVER